MARVGHPTLPAPLTPFVGRAHELAALRDLLQRGDVRLITLTGPGGVGKTRLAQEAARDAEATFADGVALVPLAPLQDPSLLPTAILQALDLIESDVAPAARLQEALRGRRLLLMLDNFEHLNEPEAGRLLVDLLAAAPRVTILVTSRSLLHLTGEHGFIVPPLALPARGQFARPRDLTALGSTEAVQLFVDRAKVAWPEFALTEENAQAVAGICQRVDGLPLAIELAAARSAVLPPSALLARLDQRLPLLSGGPHDQPQRLRTMRSAISWSYELLDSATRALLRNLAIFTGGFTLEAAEYVEENVDPSSSVQSPTSPPGAKPSPPERGVSPSVLDALATLLSGSLLQRIDQPDGEPRFGMLETVREFAYEQLVAAGEEVAASKAHTAYYLEFLRRAEPILWAATNKRLLDQIETEHDNLRSALTWGIEHDPVTALELVDGLAPFWLRRSYWVEGRSWVERVLKTGAGAETAARAAALGRFGAMAGEQGDYLPAREALEESYQLADRLGETQLTARALRGLGILASNQSDFEQAEPHFQQALALFRRLDDRPGIARCLNDLGLIAERQANHDRAIAFYDEALPIARAIGDEWEICVILGNLGGGYFERGDFARGEALFQEALELARHLGDTFGVAVNLFNLGISVMELGDVGGALVRYRESLALSRDLGEQHLANRTLDRLAIALHAAGASRAAARLNGAAAAVREAIDDTLFADEAANMTARFAAIRAELGEAVYDAAWASGNTLPFARALDEGLALADSALLAYQAAPARAVAGLTVREVEVLRLLTDGKSDKEIAAELFISARTVSSHVAAIMAKLGAESRTAAVAAAFRGGLV